MIDVEKQVKIKLQSTITPTEGESESYELWLQGSFIQKRDKMYLRYVEELDGKSIRTTVRLNEDKASILRSGGVNMRLPFNLEIKENGHYESPYGMLPLLTKTHQLNHAHNDETSIEGSFYVNYDLIIGGQAVGEYQLEIHYSEGQA
ncbi:DUF1934 domain-containing protein [Ureibacillus acetophenoni]|uniref:Uncharacterized beta-barrel protein YwiB n=1 Tax=Ureibacillus acetophenoni TaxID=614649 RepID=A0A285TZ07_9BACL|nr:DUF1934 domain-containing protein [Ureibacillus acetophenoni]SOC34687.1 uncharacterized beta-barrel protein YwiB [Ureibacillus acetophenoni]